jgi:hypothetical protein
MVACNHFFSGHHDPHPPEVHVGAAIHEPIQAQITTNTTIIPGTGSLVFSNIGMPVVTSSG